MDGILNRLSSWMKNGLHFLIVIIAIIALLGTLCFIFNKFDLRVDLIRLFGVAFEGGGLLTVVISIDKARKKYGECSYFTAFSEWLIRDSWSIICPRSSNYDISCTTTPPSLSMLMTNSGKNCNSIEEKVEYLIQRTATLEMVLNEHMDKDKQAITELLTKNSAINGKIKTIEDDIKDNATTDYYMLVSGVLLTIIGMLITNLP